MKKTDCLKWQWNWEKEVWMDQVGKKETGNDMMNDLYQ
jgi:hypothetical protein